MSTRTMRSLVKCTVAASVLGAAALAASAAPASAASVVYFFGGYNQEVICTPGTTHGLNSGLARGFYAVSNGCGTRVWLQGGTGWTYCLSPHAFVYLPTWAEWPIKAGISTNPAQC
jgi:hypothetical protein